MSKTRCTGIRKDGKPCQANGLAHGAPPEQAREWRSRRDNRMPEQLKHALDIVQDSMDQLAQQEPTPAICNAISRSAQTLINIRRRADEEMELIRAEEIQAAAAVIAGGRPDLDIGIFETTDWDVLTPSLKRRLIDDAVFDLLDLTQGERDAVYEGVTELVENRRRRAQRV